MAQQIVLTNTVKDSQLGQRLDQAIAELFADFSRSRLKEWLLDGKVQVNGEVVTKPRTKVMGARKLLCKPSWKMKNAGKRKISH